LGFWLWLDGMRVWCFERVRRWWKNYWLSCARICNGKVWYCVGGGDQS
jgi:hypothetical protein